MKKILSTFKQDIEDLRVVLIAAMSYKVASVIVAVLFILGLIADMKGVNAIYGTLELMGVAIIIALLAIMKVIFEKPKHIVAKAFIFSTMWLASCLALTDFDEVSPLFLFKIVTAFEYIFLGCLLPEVVSKLEDCRENNTFKDDSLKDMIDKSSKT